MIRMTKRIPSVALIALLLVFGACKGESPTAPPAGGPNPPGGSTPPTGVTLTLAASNETPLVDSTVVVTANVTQNGQPVPNGTAVEFSTNRGTFTDTQTTTTIRTTTNGVATATLTASTAGPTRITATVNNVTRTVDVTFQGRPVTPPTPGTAPSITSISPSIGRPSGGETIRITGTNFIGPVRVLFDVGGAAPVEGFVVSRTDTQIEVITPAVNLGAGQQLVSRVIIITQAGSTSEQRVEAATGFTFRNEALTPRVSTISPNSGPVLGGTRVSIFGDGFQAPVQVHFGSIDVPSWQEAQVVEVKFDEIVVITPEARSTAPGGSGVVTGPVDLRVVNIRSNTEVVVDNVFRYIAAMQITAAGPTQGPTTGGTSVTIEGTGFVAPVAVTIGGVAAQPIFVSGSRIVAVTSAVALTACANVVGPITVTNISNGDTASGPPFTFRLFPPSITNVTPTTVQPGQNVTITVANAQPGTTRIKLGDRTVFATGSITPDGTGIFIATVPSNFTFTTQACTVGGIAGTRQIASTVDVIYQNVQSTCTDTVDDALTINPCVDGAGNPTPCPCVLPPPPEATVTNPVSPACAVATDSVATAAGTTTTITFSNDGGQPLTLVPQPVSGTDAAQFTLAPASLTVAPGTTGSFTVTFTAAGAPGSRSATATFQTNDPTDNETLVNVCLQGNAIP